MICSKSSLSLLLAAFTASNLFCVDAFSVHRPSSLTRCITSPFSTVFMSDMADDFPSDSSVEDMIDVESEEVEPTPSENLVTSIFDSLPMDKLTTSVSKETRASINEALLKLEAMNPTEEPASSSLLNGVWTLKYAGGYDDDWALASPTRQIALFLYSGGYSPGLFALSLAQSLPSSLVEIGELEIAISREQPRVEAKIDVKFVGGAANDVVVKAALDTKSDVRLTETYEAASVLGQSIDLPQAVQYSRDLYITYLDEDIMVARDGSGVPEIVMRKK
mmetsp:Transcript_3425/g.4552  ORF Transcript_3425/g.4552 Transcript_3425/m.4552 type:complete len:277 (-) Transcript_3425:1148-1978(-)